MNQKLTLPKTKKKHTRRHLLPLAIAGVVIFGGLCTVAYEAKKDSTNTNCANDDCIKTVVLKVATKNESEKQLKAQEDQGYKEPIKAPRMDDIELENNRLLLQRDIQRAINATSPNKPFNYSENDFCLLTLTKDHKSLRVTECTNHVYKRTLDLALEKVTILPLLEKYDFRKTSPILEARLKF